MFLLRGPIRTTVMSTQPLAPTMPTKKTIICRFYLYIGLENIHQLLYILLVLMLTVSAYNILDILRMVQ